MPIVRTEGDTGIIDPSIVPAAVAQAILHAERLAGVEMRRVDVKTPIEVIGMHALGPASPKLLLEGSAGKLQPPPVASEQGGQSFFI
jgi:hypothetical protein